MAEQSEQQKFLEELDIKKEDVLEKPLTIETPEEEKDEDTEMKLRNRRERRLAEKLQSEREANIALNERLKVITETKAPVGEEADYLKRVKAIFGDDTPEKREATNILLDALKGVKESAKGEALAEAIEKIEGDRESIAATERKENETLDEVSDRMEEDYSLDMSNDAVRRGYFTLMEKMSPKDDEGNVKEYADPDAVAETFLELQKRSSSRAKELASRSMTRSGASSDSKLQDDSTVRFLKENGII